MNDLVITKKTFDIKKLFKEKNPALSRWIPGIFYTFLKRKLHQKEFNKFLYDNKDKMDFDFVDAALDFLGITTEVTGIENIPKTGKCTLAGNHPLGGPEGMALMRLTGKIRKEITFLSNDVLMKIPNLKSLFTPVNKFGSNTKHINLYNETFNSDKLVLIFPAGMVSRKIKGEIRDLLWKSSFISRSKKYSRKIIPVFIEGSNSKFFYFFANLRVWLGIRKNLEMFLLPDEMIKQKGKTIKMVIGKPVPSEIFDNRMNNHQWSALFKDYVYELKDNPGLVFNNDYIHSRK